MRAERASERIRRMPVTEGPEAERVADAGSGGGIRRAEAKPSRTISNHAAVEQPAPCQWRAVRGIDFIVCTNRSTSYFHA
jgi:hypothetical protein